MLFFFFFSGHVDEDDAFVFFFGRDGAGRRVRLVRSSLARRARLGGERVEHALGRVVGRVDVARAVGEAVRVAVELACRTRF